MEHLSKLKKMKRAALALRLSSVRQRNRVLMAAARQLITHQNLILKENLKDLKALDNETPVAFRDRLTLNPTRIKQMAESLKQVAALSDPLAQVSEKKILKNGLVLEKVRSPLGVIFMIFESRPNVAVEAFSMGFKSGNAMILRGGKESRYTTAVLYKILEKSFSGSQIQKDVLWGITNPDRKIVNQLLQEKSYIDIVVPRGGEKLIQYVVENSQMPIIKNDRGLCHVYVHQDADIKMAVQILVNAKTQRPSVCNSMETMLIHEKLAPKILPLIYEAMSPFQVKWYSCVKTKKILKERVQLAQEKNWNTEYLDQMVNCKIVKNIDEALLHIQKYSSGHSESIITKSVHAAKKFQKELDVAVVYWNASTRFTDGFEFGLGGELGISTQKLHVRGPVGLEALTNLRWVVTGSGQVR